MKELTLIKKTWIIALGSISLVVVCLGFLMTALYFADFRVSFFSEWWMPWLPASMAAIFLAPYYYSVWKYHEPIKNLE